MQVGHKKVGKKIFIFIRVIYIINILAQELKVYSMVAWLVGSWLVGWLVGSFVRSFVGWFVRSLVRSFVRSFVGWFVRSLVGRSVGLVGWLVGLVSWLVWCMLSRLISLLYPVYQSQIIPIDRDFFHLFSSLRFQ